MPDDHAPRWPLEGVSQRLPPSNLQAEQALLGAILHNNRAHDRVAEFLRDEHFADPINGRIYSAISRRITAGHVTDAVTLRNEFENSCVLDEVGGTTYLAHLLTAMIGFIDVTEYGRVIHDTWRRRQLIEAAEVLCNRAFGTDPGQDVEAIAAEAMLAIEATNSITHGARIVSHDQAMDAALASMERARLGKTAGISTGFRCLDHRLGGLEPGLVYVLGGRPGMGKSSIGHQIAVNVARAGVRVLELSLEMSAEQLARRSLATVAGVPITAFKDGSVDILQADAIVRGRQELAGLPLDIDDTAGRTPAQIAAQARTHRRKHGLGLIMVDHLNLMRADEGDAKHGGTWAVERASATMLQLAKDCACPVLLLAQLNRGVEGREDKRPTLSDLRQAGAIEQDAYAVGFVFREEYYLGGEPAKGEGETQGRFTDRVAAWQDHRDRCAGRAEIIWRKVRDGEPGTDHFTFNGPTATFGEPHHG